VLQGHDVWVQIWIEFKTDISLALCVALLFLKTEPTQGKRGEEGRGKEAYVRVCKCVAHVPAHQKRTGVRGCSEGGGRRKPGRGHMISSSCCCCKKKEGEEEPTPKQRERKRQKPSPKNIYGISSKEFHFIAGGKALEEDEIKERKKRLEKEKLVRIV